MTCACTAAESHLTPSSFHAVRGDSNFRANTVDGWRARKREKDWRKRREGVRGREPTDP
jgi:hypothetical protein